MSDIELKKILEFWHIQEFLLPQSLENIDKINDDTKSLRKAFAGNTNNVVKWIYEKLKYPPKDDYIWQFMIYGGIYKIEDVKKQLLTFFDEEDDVESREIKDNAATFSLALDPTTQKIKLDDIQVSTVLWALKQISKDPKNFNLSLPNFNKELELMVATLQQDVGSLSDDKLTLEEEINKVATIAFQIFGFDAISNCTNFIVIATQKSQKNAAQEKNDNDILNSFFIEDINKTLTFLKNGKSDNLITQYLNMDESAVKNNRTDIRKNLEYSYNILAPMNFPDACWPTNEHHPLVYSQQFAINSIIKRFNSTSNGFYGVNGPPGTGKTTMLRDLIAYVVTERAKILARSENHEVLFQSSKAKQAWKTENWTQYINLFTEDLLGFEMVVASSNNGAVENVTLEIPTQKSIDPSWLENFDYFKEIGTRIIKESKVSAWGMGAACLGNASNKNAFVSNFWYEDKKEHAKTIQGFKDYLLKIKQRSEDDLIAEWKLARKSFQDALNMVQKMKKEKNSIYTLAEEYKAKTLNENKQITALISENSELEKKIATDVKSIDQTEQLIQNKKSASQQFEFFLQTLDNKISTISVNLSDTKELLNAHSRRKMSFLETILDLIFSKGKRSKAWNNKMVLLEQDEQNFGNDIIGLKKKKSETQLDLEQISFNVTKLEKQKQEYEENINKYKLLISQNTSKIATHKKSKEEYDRLYQSALKTQHQHEKRSDKDTERELSSPWMDDEFFKARAKLFIEALNLHKAFIHVNAKKIQSNLLCIIDILQGTVRADTEFKEAVRHAWATLFLCVPVVSTTFASFPRLFKHFWNHEIGWLLIDEAGQAPAQAAVGAIMRSKRCIVVGDPLQLEPIIGLPLSIQNILRKKVNAHDDSLLQRTSVQKRVDFTETNGTYLEDTNNNNKIWVGSPLRVHRRCNNPMFEISNSTTYLGMMVQGKKDVINNLPMSQWYDVQSLESSGNWIPDEGKKTQELINDLSTLGITSKELYIISPFKDVIKGLKALFAYSKQVDSKNKIGTIHTVQGKEAKVVILVLGSDPNKDNSRTWAASKPNLLNVAATRAKERFYIIGNQRLWGNKQYFKDALALLNLNSREI
ncbi:DEAD/DEAH box helicase [Sulfurospirillum sp. UCH001]|uniref:DEAD/DEAH box helicase n=1 Tax=Sulfurospirillum sp. UCH001 TaxID=1581011 RepID=UPI000829AF96|nr:DEAD/DEAH box helicase [Sulfurospirillum sp. UCH001]